MKMNNSYFEGINGLSCIACFSFWVIGLTAASSIAPLKNLPKLKAINHVGAEVK
jgi:hypothetical protein